MYEEALIVFFKTPEIGKVKTRLASSLGDELALNIYKEMLISVIQTSLSWAEASPGRLVLPFGFGSPVSWHQYGIKTGHRQVGADLGFKMQHAMQFGLRVANKVSIIGTDNPDLSVNDIELAFSKLDEKDVVFGPCEDGGYYLMGANKMLPTLLWDLPWSTEETLKLLCRRCEGHKLSLGFLDTKTDIDTLEDLETHQFATHIWKTVT